MALRLDNNSDYINSTDYKKLSNKLEDLKSVLRDLTDKSYAGRKLRYAEVDIEVEREAGRIQPDELYVPQHIIDTNIRREQSSYVQFITQSPRAVILEDSDDPTVDLAPLEKDLTKKLRFDGWQLSMYANIDAFQANGYSVMEVVQDQSTPGDVAHEVVQLGDFAFVSDTRDLQAVEMTARQYYYTKTRLLELCDPSKYSDVEDAWNKEQVEKIVGKASDSAISDPGDSTDTRDKSLYKVHKVMFRIKGVVHVGWCCIGTTDDWARKPRPLYIGRRKVVEQPGIKGIVQKVVQTVTNQPPQSVEDYETNYPYFLYPYLISENDTISHLKGRVFLDQDVQEAVSSLLSSTVTQARRAAGMYFSKDVSDPNDDLLLQKNIFFRSGCLINSKVQSFSLPAPDPSMFSAIQMLVSGNQNETSQVNFSTLNRKDSRKTAAELKLSNQQEQLLSSVQVVLFSIALRQQYTLQCEIVKSRVMAGLIKVSPSLQQLYARQWIVKPSGDTDVMEKNQLIQMMLQMWSIVAATPIALPFLSDLLEKMFPDNAPKYLQQLQQAQQQQQSQQSQMMQQGMQMMQQMGAGIMDLAKHPEYFSDTGRVHAFPVVENVATQLEQMEKQMPKQSANGAQ
jgi:hypothetical protein